MTSLGQIPAGQLGQQLADGGVRLRVGPYIYNVRSNLATVVTGLSTLYRDFPLAATDAFVDFEVALHSRGPGQRWRRRANFYFDGRRTFDTIPCAQGHAFLEWGMNWCVSLYCNEYLTLHAAVVARSGSAVIMPGVPGAGKSTLCAALGLRGWRILSDEHAMIAPGSLDVVPLCRPVSLKNESIDAVRALDTRAVFGPVARETHKGVVAHMKADLHPDSHRQELIPAGCMVFPRFSRAEHQQLRERRRTESFVLAAYHAFNYSLLGEVGFDSLGRLIAAVPCYDLVYSDLEWAVATMDQLTGNG